MLSWRRRNPKALLPVNIADARSDDPVESPDPKSPNSIPPYRIVGEYLQGVSPVFRYLGELRRKVNNSPPAGFFSLTYPAGLGKSRGGRVLQEAAIQCRQRRPSPAERVLQHDAIPWQRDGCRYWRLLLPPSSYARLVHGSWWIYCISA